MFYMNPLQEKNMIKKHLLHILLLISHFSLCLGDTEDFWKAEEYFHNSSSQKDAATDLMKFVNIRENDHILDVGCGDGKITAEIAEKTPNGTVMGVDISPAMITF